MSTIFFITSCAIIGSPRSECTRISRYWPNETMIAVVPIKPSSRAWSWATEKGRRLESNAIMPARIKMASDVNGKDRRIDRPEDEVPPNRSPSQR